MGNCTVEKRHIQKINEAEEIKINKNIVFVDINVDELNNLN